MKTIVNFFKKIIKFVFILSDNIETLGISAALFVILWFSAINFWFFLSVSLIYLVIIFQYIRSEKEKYEDIIHDLKYGYPTEEELELYENDLMKIEKKYRGREIEIFTRQRKFIVQKRIEIMLNNLKKERFNK